MSVYSQADTERADLRREQAELETDPAGEEAELAAIYVGRGLEPALARTVAEQLTAHGALAAHARDELQRARPRRRHDDSLTAAETRVASLAAKGLTNREIAAQQFTTTATVEAHLTRIYAKLRIRSRTDLARLVSDGSLRLDGHP